MLKLNKETNKGYILIEKDGQMFWSERAGLIERYEHGEFMGYVIKKGYFEDNYLNEVDTLIENNLPNLAESKDFYKGLKME